MKLNYGGETMALSNHLISQFVKVTDDTDKSKKEKSTYGTIKEYNGEKYVQIDGSNMLTPYFSTTIVKDGDRVVVDLKDHNAVVSGNITSPATRSDDFNSEVTNTAENFKATNASIDTLKVKQGQFEELATEKLNAAEANIDTLTTRVGEFESATAENFTATNASIENLSGDFANFKVTTTDSLTANEANITKVSGDLADFITVTTDTFKSTDAEITNLKTAKADVDLANIDVANIGILFNKVGLIDRATIVDGHITGFLDAVEINADSITAGTLVADRILLTGSQNGLLYQLNNLGELTSTNVDTLDGSILTERTVTADKLVAKSITANELDVNNIFGNSAVLTTLTSQQAFINAISTNSIVVGASNTANSALNAVNNLEIGGRNLLPINDMEQGDYNGTNKTVRISIPLAKRKYIEAGTILTFSTIDDLLLSWFVITDDSNNIIEYCIQGSNEKEYIFTVQHSGYLTPIFGKSDGNGSWTEVTIDYIRNCYIKLEKGNKATDWTPAPEDISVENIYTPNTTTIDGGKITTNSIKASSIDVNNLFAQSAFIDAVSSNTVVVRASNAANNALYTVNNLEIGGRNLLRNSALTDSFTYWSKMTTSGAFEFTTKDNRKCVHINSSELKKTSYLSQGRSFDFKPDTLYTLSMWVYSENIVKGTTNYFCNFYMGGYNGSNGWHEGFYKNVSGSSAFPINNGKWEKLVYTFKSMPSTLDYNNKNVCPYLFFRDFTGDFYFYNFKMEEGNKATDWTPAPEDISVENIYTAGTTTIDGGKITTGSITAKQIDVKDLFAQDITATGTITGATLEGAHIYSKDGLLGPFYIYENGLEILDPNYEGRLMLGDRPSPIILYNTNLKKTVFGVDVFGEVSARGDIIAGYGTDNQVSLQTLNSKAGVSLSVSGTTVKLLNAAGTVLSSITTKDTNTWRGIENVLTSTSTSNSLSANMGRTLNNTKQEKLAIAGSWTNGYIRIPGISVQIAWKNVSYTGTISSAWGSGYETSGQISLGQWAASFKSGTTPVATYSACANSGSADVGVNVFTGPTASSAGAVYLQRNTADHTSRAYRIYVVAIGPYG